MDHTLDPLDRLALENPQRYRLQVALLALLGFAALGGSFLVALALAAGLLALLVAGKAIALLKLVIIPLALAWSILKSLFVRIDPPEGIWLRPGEAPALDAEVERLRRATGAPRLSGIVVTDDFNAAAATVPRLLGLLGHRHYLVLGLPLMQALPREQFAAVVAHEFGHFGGGHSRFAGWIYRVRASWLRVRIALDEQHGWLGAPMRKFFDWYAPFFGRYSFAFARQNEYEADAAAARIVGAEAAASTLVATSLGVRRQADFWPRLWRQVGEEATTPADVYARLGESLRTPAEREADRLEEALRETSTEEDTHPSLAQRLHALGCAPMLPVETQDSALSLLGERGPALVAELSARWSAAAADNWSASHRQIQAQRQRVTELGAIAPEARSTTEQVELACLRDDLDEGGDLVAALLAASELQPENAEVQFRLGRRALDEGDGRGVGAIEAALRLDPDRMDGGLMRLYAWYRQQEDAEGMARIQARGEELERQRERSLAQRRLMRAGDRFRAHGLDDERLQAVQGAVRRFGKAKRVWIARKQLEREDGAPHFVVVVKWRALTPTGDDTLK
jgi:Zn-dependent protease with chaperone function